MNQLVELVDLGHLMRTSDFLNLGRSHGLSKLNAGMANFKTEKGLPMDYPSNKLHAQAQAPSILIYRSSDPSPFQPVSQP